MEKPISLKIKKINPDAKLPRYAHSDDAGMDLFSIDDVTLQPGESVAIPTGIAMEIPNGHVGLIWDKSGIAITHGIKVLGGVVDAGYRGEVLVGMILLGKNKYTIRAGEKIAQMLIQEITHPDIKETDFLSDTKRGDGRLGSTGK